MLQGNLNRARAADDLLTQLVHELTAHIVIISEPYRNRSYPNWYTDVSGTAAIWVVDPVRYLVLATGSGNGYVWVRTKHATFMSIYLSPNDFMADFHLKVDNIEDTLQGFSGPLIVAGDFNARAPEWGMPTQTPKGAVFWTWWRAWIWLFLTKVIHPRIVGPGLVFLSPMLVLCQQVLPLRRRTGRC